MCEKLFSKRFFLLTMMVVFSQLGSEVLCSGALPTFKVDSRRCECRRGEAPSVARRLLTAAVAGGAIGAGLYSLDYTDGDPEATLQKMIIGASTLGVGTRVLTGGFERMIRAINYKKYITALRNRLKRIRFLKNL